jgi:hypothetical protein
VPHREANERADQTNDGAKEKGAAMLNVFRDLYDLLQARASDGRKAFDLTDAVFTKIGTALRRDPRFANLTNFELELLLADVRNEMERALFTEMVAHIHLDDAANAVELVLGEPDFADDNELLRAPRVSSTIFDDYLNAQSRMLPSNLSK